MFPPKVSKVLIATPLPSETSPETVDMGDGRFWNIWYANGSVITSFGKKGGKVSRSETKVPTNTSGRSVADQAKVVIENKVRLKKRQATTDERMPDPMLARVAQQGDFFKDSMPVATQPKIDGVRCLAIVSPLGELVSLTSRGRKDSFPHIKPLLKEPIARLHAALSGEVRGSATVVVFDGELFSTKTFQETVSIVRADKKPLPPGDIIDRLRYGIFSFYVMGSEGGLSFRDRNTILGNAFATAGNSSAEHSIPVIKVPTTMCHTVSDINAAKKTAISNGYEGLMVYTPDGTYQPGKRSAFLHKMKDFDEDEGTIVGVVPAKGGREADAALVVVGLKGGNKTITMRPAATIEERRVWLKDPHLIMGKQMTFTFQGLTSDGVPRFPVARTVRDYE